MRKEGRACSAPECIFYFVTRGLLRAPGLSHVAPLALWENVQMLIETTIENQNVFFSIICVNPCLSADKNSGFYFGFLLEIAIKAKPWVLAYTKIKLQGRPVVPCD
jgi:hypothetical protein